MSENENKSWFSKPQNIIIPLLLLILMFIILWQWSSMLTFLGFSTNDTEKMLCLSDKNNIEITIQPNTDNRFVFNNF